jgi:parallel beta-helix repeat protein
MQSNLDASCAGTIIAQLEAPGDLTHMKKLGFIVLVTHLLGGAAAGQSGATYYVATNGNDSYSCSQAQSQFTPKRSLNNAVTCVRLGGTLLVRGGTYNESLVNPQIAGTSWSSKVRIAAYQGEAVWLKPPAGGVTAWIIDMQGGQHYVEFDGINLDTTNATPANALGGLAVWGDSDSHHIRFQNAEILGNRLPGDLGTSRDGIMLQGGLMGFNEILRVKIHGSGGPNSYYGMYIHSSDNVVDGAEIYDMGMMGIQIYTSGASTPSRNIVRNSRIHDIVTSYDQRRDGVLIAGNDNQVYNNLIYNINADGSGNGTGLTIYSGTNNQILNNTIANNRASAIAIGSVAGTLIANNIAYNNDFDGVSDYGGTGTILGPNDFGTDPGFVDATQGNFQLRLGSVAVDAGTAYSIVQTDAAGVQRPQGGAYDLGAYELTNVNVQVPPQAPTGVQVVQSAP